ncbi:MAG: M14-type cytosolic carboxypeptidase [Xanthomonadales bacterium]|nr:M14-type cytosolic carboxypeptidase [Xanthomonadales bacterium]
MNISSAFDSGNIICDSCDDPSNVQLRIRVDNESHFFQWFHFRVTGAADQACCFHLTNASEAAYLEGWDDYQAVASYDRDHWFRVPTSYDDGVLKIEHEPALDSVWYAYFAPYSMERHLDLVATAAQGDGVRYEHLGHTLDGQDMDLLVIGEETPDKRKCWFIARQHPGETMAEWWMEGFLDRLLDADEPIARELLKKAVFYVVPNMNPDGSRRGHLRTNAVGVNLNRAWSDASTDQSPEVFFVKQRMKQAGVDFALDVHGDEALPYNFIAGAEGVGGWTARLDQLTEAFKSMYVTANPDFQTEFGYGRDEPGSSDLRKATDYIAETFDCLSMTLEMPFKDNANAPDEITGWSPARCRLLGASVLDPLYRLIDDLR